MFKKRNFSVFTILMVGLLTTGVALAATVPNDQPDSSAYVGRDWNCYLPAFKDVNGVSIPFKPTGILRPIDYQGDFYVSEFTDAKIKQAWQELKEKNPEAAKKTKFGGVFACGAHVFSICTKLLVETLPDQAIIAAMGLNDLQWVSPARPGDTVVLEIELIPKGESKSHPDAGILQHKNNLFNKEGQLVMTAQGISLVEKRCKA